MVFLYRRNFSPRPLDILTQKDTNLTLQLGLILIWGANSQMSRERGDTKIDLGSMKNYFWEHQENNSGSREKRVEFQREPGAGDPPPPSTRKLIIYIIALFESYNDPRTSKFGTDFIGTILN